MQLIFRHFRFLIAYRWYKGRLMLLILVVLQVQSYGQAMPDSLKSRLTEIFFQYIPENAPGAAVGIIQEGQIIYENYGGYEDLDSQTLIDSNSRFNIASNGKQFTALAIVLLEQEGKLSLKDDIRTYFPELYAGIEAPITIKHLLTHQSGIRDVYDLWGLMGTVWWENYFSNQDVLKVLRDQRDLNFEPGSDYLYSNSNYILLAEIAGMVSGQPFVAFTSQMFEQLGMPNTSFVSEAENIEGPVAKPYFNFGEWSSYEWICTVHGDGNLFSTMEDQLHWEKILQTKDSVYLSQTILQKIQHLPEDSGEYGFGLEFSTHKGLPYQFHEGATGAWKATTIRFPQEKLSIVTLTNSGKITPDTQSRVMADAILKVDSPDAGTRQPAKKGSYMSEEEVVGVYHQNSPFYFQFELREDDLYLVRSGRNDQKLVRESDNVFHQWNDPSFKQEFTRNQDGEMEVTAYHTSHDPYTLKRLNADWKEFDYSSLDGKYSSTELGVDFTLTYAEGKSYAVQLGEQTTTGILITPDRMIVDGYVLNLEQSDSSELTAFLSGGRLRKVKFEQVRK